MAGCGRLLKTSRVQVSNFCRNARRVLQPAKNPFIDTLTVVIEDVKWFLLLLGLTLWGYACAFYILFRHDQQHEVLPLHPTDSMQSTDVRWQPRSRTRTSTVALSTISSTSMHACASVDPFNVPHYLLAKTSMTNTCHEQSVMAAKILRCTGAFCAMQVQDPGCAGRALTHSVPLCVCMWHYKCSVAGC